MRKKIEKKFEMFLLEIFLRIAKHWQCDIHISRKKTKEGNVKWIKVVFPD